MELSWNLGPQHTRPKLCSAAPQGVCTLLLKRVFSHEWGKLGTQSCFQVLYVSQSGKSIQALSTRPDFQAHRDAETLCLALDVSCPRCVLSVLMACNPSQANQGGLSGQK